MTPHLRHTLTPFPVGAVLPNPSWASSVSLEQVWGALGAVLGSLAPTLCISLDRLPSLSSGDGHRGCGHVERGRLGAGQVRQVRVSRLVRSGSARDFLGIVAPFCMIHVDKLVPAPPPSTLPAGSERAPPGLGFVTCGSSLVAGVAKTQAHSRNALV